MDSQFWHRRWREGRIGWHLGQVNPWLEKYWAKLAQPPGARVFVPLCGKSLDMRWLSDRGYQVLGVELSGTAVRAFCEEQGLTAQATQEGRHLRHSAGSIELLEGDFFHLEPEQLAGVKAVWDRAALVALPESLRRDYVRHLAGLLEPGTRMLLVTMEYPQGEMQGPPFSVPEEEVRTRFSPFFQVELLERQDMLADNPALRERGLSRLLEQAWRLRRL